MMRKKKLLIPLTVFGGLIVVTIGVIYLMKQDYIPEKVVSFVLIFSIISAFIIGNLWSLNYERNKTFKTLIVNDLAGYGFKLLDERPLTFKEIFKYLDLMPKPTIFVGDLPIGRFGYKSKNYRMLMVQHSYEGFFWICAEITITLKNKTRLLPLVVRKVQRNLQAQCSLAKAVTVELKVATNSSTLHTLNVWASY